MQVNFVILLVSALIPLFMGFVWYHPKTFANTWMREAEVSEEKIKGRSMGLIFSLTLLLSFFLSFAMEYIVIHQMHVYSIFANDPTMSDPNSELGLMLKDFMEKYQFVQKVTVTENGKTFYRYQLTPKKKNGD
jgi:hypothetical protein